MSSHLKAFLRPSPVGKTKEVTLERFTDGSGNLLPFVVQSISSKESDAITALCTREDGTLDPVQYADRMIVACLKEPDLRDAELCKYYGVMDPLEVPGMMFSPGEKKIIEQAVLDINDMVEAVEKLKKAKNS